MGNRIDQQRTVDAVIVIRRSLPGGIHTFDLPESAPDMSFPVTQAGFQYGGLLFAVIRDREDGTKQLRVLRPPTSPDPQQIAQLNSRQVVVNVVAESPAINSDSEIHLTYDKALKRTSTPLFDPLFEVED